MNTRKIFISSLLLALVMAVSLLTATPAYAIIGGQPDGNAHPYVGGIDVRPTGRSIPCTGTLISPTVFLTAGHCTRFFDEAGLTEARVTFDPVFSDNATFYTGSVHTNPLYTPFMTGSQSDPGDFGVIVFSEPVTGITPASLPTAGLLDQFGPKDLRTWSSRQLATASPGYWVAPMAAGRRTLTGTRLARACWRLRPSFRSLTPGCASRCSIMAVLVLVTRALPTSWETQTWWLR